MSVARGKFNMYPRAFPALKPGRYAVSASQQATKGSRTLLKDDESGRWTLSVTAPRLVLGPQEVLGSFPPPDTRDANNQQLPHIVLRQRSLPWARTGPGAVEGRPWMALLLFRADEATLTTNGTLGAFATLLGKTPTTVFPGLQEELYPVNSAANAAKLAAEPMMWVRAKQSTIRGIIPRLESELHLLAHVREVNTEDDEGRGDDDGFIAVILGNRLPREAATDWLACLVNLEPFAPDHAIWKVDVPPVELDDIVVKLPDLIAIPDLLDLVIASGLVDKASLDRDGGALDLPASALVREASAPKSRTERTILSSRTLAVESTAKATERSFTSASLASASLAGVRVAEDPAMKIVVTDAVAKWKFPKWVYDPSWDLPVLAQWRFRTADGPTDFESLIKHIGARAAVGGKGAGNALFASDVKDLSGGHLKVDHVSRGGEPGSAYYRGPLTATAVSASAFPADPHRLVTADQLLTVLAETGKEDVSLASAWELGRLLALSRKDILQILVDWQRLARQQRFKLAIGKQLRPLRIPSLIPPDLIPYGLLNELGLMQKLIDVGDHVTDPVFDVDRLDYTGLIELANVAVAIPGLDASAVLARTGLTELTDVMTNLRGLETSVFIPDFGDIGTLDDLTDMGGVFASGDLSSLDSRFPELLEMLRADPTRRGP